MRFLVPKNDDSGPSSDRKKTEFCSDCLYRTHVNRCYINTLWLRRISEKSFRDSINPKIYLGFLKKVVILHHVLVRGNAINRESGENPEQTRYCNSYKTRQHDVTVGTADGKALVSRISQETCQGNILFCSFRVILPQNSHSTSRNWVFEYGLLCNILFINHWQQTE